MRIIISRAAHKAMKRLPADLRRRILSALEALPAGDVTKLQGRDGFRLRVGNWRVLFTMTTEAITVLDIGPRGGVYR